MATVHPDYRHKMREDPAKGNGIDANSFLQMLFDTAVSKPEQSRWLCLSRCSVREGTCVVGKKKEREKKTGYFVFILSSVRRRSGASALSEII